MGKKANTWCDQCGRDMDKAHRRWKGESFCTTCYAREFRPVSCVSCRTTWRIHKSVDTGEPCPACKRKTRRCARCDRPVEKAALLIENVAICPSCRPYAPSTGGWKTPEEHATCCACGRHRKVDRWTAEGRPVCKACRDPKNAVFEAEKNAAYWSRTLPKRWAFAREALYQPWCRRLFDEFLLWGRKRIPDPVLAMKVPKYSLRFRELEKRLPEVALINTENLLRAFTSEELFRMGHVIEFLRHQGFSTPERDVSEACSDERRIQQSLEAVAENAHHSVLKRYSEHLESPDQSSLAPRTRRLYIAAAKQWILDCDTAALNQEQLARFLKKKPGQRASLHKFITFLNSSRKSQLKIPIKKKRRSKAALIKRGRGMFEQINQALDGSLSFEHRKSLTAALIVGLTGISLKDVLEIRSEDVRSNGNQCSVRLEGQWGDFPAKHNQQLFRYLDEWQREHGLNPQLVFPGRPDFQPMHPTTIASHLAKFGISIQAVKAQATYRLAKRTQ